MKCASALALFFTIGFSTVAGASTPVANDPILGARTAFGRVVTISGDYAFIGEPSTGGRGGAPAGIVHVYKRGPTGWKEVDKLTAPGTVAGDAFGISVAADGATLLVGRILPPAGRSAQLTPTGVVISPLVPDSSHGAVIAFQRNAMGKWSAGTLVAEGRVGSQFGAAMVVAGNTALIGAPTDSGGGSVRIFRRSQDGTWSAAGTLPASGLAPGDRFGASIAIDGDRVAVGAPSRKLKGAVFVFHRAADGSWTQETEQPAAVTTRDGAQFGSAVGVKGDRVFVGAPAANFAALTVLTPLQTSQISQIDSAFRKGAIDQGLPAPPSVANNFGPQLVAGFAVVFERAKTGSWRNAGTLLPMSLSSERFGSSFAMVGDELWIGAPGSDGMGRIYRARQDKDGNWTAMSKLVVDSIDANAGFAASFAVSSDAAVVGMPSDGGGAGTVAFLGKSPTGSWTLKGTSFPPVKDQYAAVSGKEVRCADGKVADFTCSNAPGCSRIHADLRRRRQARRHQPERELGLDPIR